MVKHKRLRVRLLQSEYKHPFSTAFVCIANTPYIKANTSYRLTETLSVSMAGSRLLGECQVRSFKKLDGTKW